LAALRWGDVHLSALPGKIILRARITKAGRGDTAALLRMTGTCGKIGDGRAAHAQHTQTLNLVRNRAAMMPLVRHILN
jgi:hypothetical protein